MDTYRIVKWLPDQPETKVRATEWVFPNLAAAESAKTAMEKCIPHCCFAVETVKECLPRPSEPDGAESDTDTTGADQSKPSTLPAVVNQPQSVNR
jgi:hypothetical protein